MLRDKQLKTLEQSQDLMYFESSMNQLLLQSPMDLRNVQKKRRKF